MRFFSKFDSIFTGSYPDIPEAKEYTFTIKHLSNRAAQLMFEGLVDGSIHTETDATLYISVLFNTISGLGERVLPRNEHYILEHNATSLSIMMTAANMLLEGIKA